MPRPRGGGLAALDAPLCRAPPRPPNCQGRVGNYLRGWTEFPAYHPCTKVLHDGEFPTRLKRKNLNFCLSLARARLEPRSLTWRRRGSGAAPARARRGPSAGPAGSGLVQSDWQPRGVRGDPDANPQDDEFLNEFNLSTRHRLSATIQASPRCSAAWPLWRPHSAWTGRQAAGARKMTFDPSSPSPPLVLGSTPRASLQHSCGNPRGGACAGERGVEEFRAWSTARMNSFLLD